MNQQLHRVDDEVRDSASGHMKDGVKRSWQGEGRRRWRGRRHARRLLLIVTSPDPKADVLERIEERIRTQGRQDIEIRIVAPASDVSFLEWLTNDEDSARATAARRAHDSAEAEREAQGGTVVGASVGDVDPLTAVEDALRTFAADEIVVVRQPDESSSWLEADAARVELENRFGLPVTQLIHEEGARADATSANGAAKSKVEQRFKDATRKVARGRSPWTGFFTITAVLVAVAIVAAVLIAIALTVYSLAR
jgi:hypothetical protein